MPALPDELRCGCVECAPCIPSDCLCDYCDHLNQQEIVPPNDFNEPCARCHEAFGRHFGTGPFDCPVRTRDGLSTGRNRHPDSRTYFAYIAQPVRESESIPSFMRPIRPAPIIINRDSECACLECMVAAAYVPGSE